MKIKLIHFNFLSEKPDTAYFSFSNFKEKIQLGTSVLTDFLFNFLTLNLINTKNSLQKFNRKVLDISSDIPVKGKLFGFRWIYKAQYPLSFITAFSIIVSSVFLHIRKTYLEFTFFYRNTEVRGFILFLQNFGVFNPYLLYRKI
jgi:hypothetical protein